MKHSGEGHTKHPMREVRESVVRSLYGWMLNPNIKAVGESMQESAMQPTYETYFKGCLEEASVAQEQITLHLSDQQWGRLYLTEQAIMLLAYYELSQCHHVPYRVVINEAIELAKQYGGDESPKLINGLVDQLALQLRALEVEMQKNKHKNDLSDVPN